ncbi:ABC transporter permease [Jiella avicenniae]|uniref:Autoinducer 2 import system permease protein LsrD n=1 Tax=Jiella avicenniae TaxID=2907202 RepID=A0A9X1P340_9HYPH|nr:ABC transporter permease [Jiella avicenniae]MCE7030167.1 ABC transporter permease [Jiella avicenniae]
MNQTTGNDGSATDTFAHVEDRRASSGIDRDLVNIVAVFALSAVLILCSRFVSPALGSWNQVLTILTLSSFLIVLSFGQGLVILVGGLDLSTPSLVVIGGVLATVYGSDGNAFYVLPIALCVCALIGLVNGAGVVILGIPPFIMTLASSIFVASAALGLTGGTPRGNSPEILAFLMKERWLGIPVVVYFVVLFAIVGWIVQSRTTLGRRLYAIGVNREAARIAGIDVGLTEAIPYAISAACAGFVGMMLVGYSDGATLRMGDSYLLPGIAAVVIGGSSILGGSGSFVGTVGGAILLTTLGTVISAIGLDQGYRTIIEGSIILVALVLLREDLFSGLRLRNRKA